jgi:hypothetical protein
MRRRERVREKDGQTEREEHRDRQIDRESRKEVDIHDRYI